MQKNKFNLMKLLFNKYMIVFLFFAVYLTFFDQYNLIKRFQRSAEVSTLNEELHFYRNETKQNREMINKLLNDSVFLIKYARETYYMHQSNEDVFIFPDTVNQK